MKAYLDGISVDKNSLNERSLFNAYQSAELKSKRTS